MEDKILNATKIAIPVVVLISVTYEFFFFKGMGSSLSQSPLGTSDFLRGWIDWSPLLIPFIIGHIFTRAYFLQADRERNAVITYQIEDAKVAKPRWLKCVQKWFTLSDLFFVSGALLLCHFLLYGEQVTFLLGTSALLFSLGVFERLHQSSITQRSRLVLATGISIFGVVAFFAASGFYRGSSVLDLDIFESDKPPEFSMKLDEQTVTVVRVFDQWALVKKAAGTYAWIHHQSGKLIEFEPHRYRFQGVVCYFSDRLCYIEQAKKKKSKTAIQIDAS
jgi:hypothetical protein